MGEEKKKFQRISAGDVILIQYMGGNKPCDRCMCITLTPIKIEEGVNISGFHTAFAIDTDTEQFIREGPINDIKASIAKVTSRKLKEWYYEKVVALCKTRNEKTEK